MQVTVKNPVLYSKMMEFGYRRAAVQDSHPNEPVCRICLAVGHDKGIENEYCPECQVDPTRLLRDILAEGEKEEKNPSKFRSTLDTSSCAKCSHSGYNKEEKATWCSLHKFPIPTPSKINVESFYSFVCEDADNKR